MGNILNYRTLTFLDVETTHLDPEIGEIIQIAILTEDSEGNLKEWSTKTKPQLKLGTYSAKALEINGYNEEEWKDAPSFSEVAETIAKKLRYGPLVAHNINFDISHLKASFKRRGWEEVKPGEKYGSGNKKFNPGYQQ